MTVSNGQRPEEGIQKTRMVRGTEAAYEFDADPDRGEPFRRNFQCSKHEQIGSSGGDDSRKDAAVALIDRGEDTGKISERLKLIEQSFLSYVRANQTRLEAELEHNRKLEQNFLEAIRQLEREINSLVPEEAEDSELNELSIQNSK